MDNKTITVPKTLFNTNRTLRFNFLCSFPTKNVIKNHQDNAPVKMLANPKKMENSFSWGAIKLKRANSIIKIKSINGLGKVIKKTEIVFCQYELPLSFGS